MEERRTAPTPEWEVDDWDLEHGFVKIEQQWATVGEILESPDLYGLREPSVSGWSCGEQAGHIALVTLWIADGIQANLAEPDRDSGGRWSEHAKAILESGRFPRGAAQAPPRVNTDGRPRDDFLSVLPAAKDAWVAVRGRAAELPACPARFHHFALGYLTSTEWVRFCAIHTAHHLRVVRDIRASVQRP